MTDYHLAGEPLGGRDAQVAGLQLLDRLYRHHCGEPLPSIERTPSGKPYFPGKNVYFSISHTKKNVFCVLSSQPVGLDAEEADRPVKLSLAKHILSPGEYAQYEQAPDQRIALLTFWVLKEADAKRTGKGIRSYPNDTHFNLNDPRVRLMDGCLVAVIDTNSQ